MFFLLFAVVVAASVFPPQPPCNKDCSVILIPKENQHGPLDRIP